MPFNPDFAELIDQAFPLWQKCLSSNPDDWIVLDDENAMVNLFVGKCVIEIVRQRKSQIDNEQSRIVLL